MHEQWRTHLDVGCAFLRRVAHLSHQHRQLSERHRVGHLKRKRKVMHVVPLFTGTGLPTCLAAPVKQFIAAVRSFFFQKQFPKLFHASMREGSSLTCNRSDRCERHPRTTCGTDTNRS